MSRSYKLWLLASLYLAQGIPYGFFTQTLPVLLRDQGFSLKAISATSILFLPWALKFLWAPLADHVGARRSWLLYLQSMAVISAGILAFVEVSDDLWIVFFALFVFNLIAAVQDTVTDGLAVNLLSPSERGLGNGLQVGAYRLGMVFGGGLLLWIFAKTGWATMFLCMSALLLLTLLPVLLLSEPRRTLQRPPARRLLSGWLPRLRQPGMLGLILLICCYKFGDSMGASLVGPFLRDQGMSKEEIALLKGALASVVTLLGAAAGGWLSFRVGRRSALLSCGLLQSASLVLYLFAAVGWGGREMMWAACIAEHLLGGMATVALFALMMDASDPAHASTDYTLLACSIIVAMGLASFTGAAIADAVGYAPLFGLATVLSLLGCITLLWMLDRGRGPARVQNIWRLH